MAAASTVTSRSASDASARSRARRTAASSVAGSGALGIDDAVHVATDHRERRDPGRGMGRREHRDRDGRTPVLAGLAQLVTHRAHRHRPILGLDHDAQVAAARDGRVDGQHEVALLALHERSRPRARCGRAGRRRRARCRRASRPSRSSKSAPLAADRARSAPRAAAAASIATRRSSRPLNPAAISWRNWCIGEFSRVGSSRCASFDASPSK